MGCRYGRTTVQQRVDNMAVKPFTKAANIYILNKVNSATVPGAMML
jgi:hypothetical protein